MNIIITDVKHEHNHHRCETWT